MSLKIKSIKIAGLGLVGGSFAKAFFKNGINIYGYDKDKNTLAYAISSGIFEGLTDNIDDFLEFESDLIYICLPVNSALIFLEELSKNSVKTLITDACSTKNMICNRALELDLNFLGGHPIAGKEVSGFNNSDENMLKGAYHILMASESKEFSDILQKIHTDIGMKIRIMEPLKHDEIFGLISHFPHLIAFSLIDFVETENMEALSFTGGGFRDFTRIAKSDPVMWSDIFFDNKEILIKYIDTFTKKLNDWKNIITGHNYNELKSMIEKVKITREGL